MLAASFSVRFRNGQQHSRWCSCSPVGPAPRSRSASRGACCGDKSVREGKTALHGRTGTQGASSAIVRGTRKASPCSQRIDGEDARLIRRGGSRRTSLPFSKKKRAEHRGTERSARQGKGRDWGAGRSAGVLPARRHNRTTRQKSLTRGHHRARTDSGKCHCFPALTDRERRCLPPR